MVRIEPGRARAFGNRLGYTAMHPYLFLVVMDVVPDDARKSAHKSMMFEDDSVLCCEDETLHTT